MRRSELGSAATSMGWRKLVTASTRLLAAAAASAWDRAAISCATAVWRASEACWYSLAAGHRAKVRNATESGDANGDEGTFVWADYGSDFTDFVSTGPNQFLISAGGGVEERQVIGIRRKRFGRQAQPKCWQYPFCHGSPSRQNA